MTPEDEEPEVTCPVCGNPVTLDDEFCPHCGAEFEEEEVEEIIEIEEYPEEEYAEFEEVGLEEVPEEEPLDEEFLEEEPFEEEYLEEEPVEEGALEEEAEEEEYIEEPFEEEAFEEEAFEEEPSEEEFLEEEPFEEEYFEEEFEEVPEEAVEEVAAEEVEAPSMSSISDFRVIGIALFLVGIVGAFIAAFIKWLWTWVPPIGDNIGVFSIIGLVIIVVGFLGFTMIRRSIGSGKKVIQFMPYAMLGVFIFGIIALIMILANGPINNAMGSSPIGMALVFAVILVVGLYIFIMGQKRAAPA